MYDDTHRGEQGLTRGVCMADLTEDFEYFLKIHGEPTGARIAIGRQSDLREKLPGALLDFWELMGSGVMPGGRFQFCDPERFSPIVREVLGNDPELPASRCHVFGHSAFGTLLAWSEDHDDFRIDLVGGTVSCLSLTGRKSPLLPDRTVAVSLFGIGDAVFDLVDDRGHLLFERARKRLGLLTPGQAYGFVPLLSLGGSRRLESLRTVDALEHFSLLAQASRFHLFDTSTTAGRSIRPLG